MPQFAIKSGITLILSSALLEIVQNISLSAKGTFAPDEITSSPLSINESN